MSVFLWFVACLLLDSVARAADPPAPAAGTGSDFRFVLRGTALEDTKLLAWVRASPPGGEDITLYVAPRGTRCDGTVLLTDLKGVTAPSRSDAYLVHHLTAMGLTSSTTWQTWVPESTTYMLLMLPTEGKVGVVERRQKEIALAFDLRTTDSSATGRGVATLCPGNPF